MPGLFRHPPHLQPRQRFLEPFVPVNETVTPDVAALILTPFPPGIGNSDYSTLIIQDGPAAYWRFGEASGHPQDVSGNLNHVTVTSGTPSYGITGALLGDDDTAITLDGSTERFTVPQATALHGNTISIELWFKRVAGGGGTQFFWDNGFGDSELYLSSDVITFGRAGIATLRVSAGTYTDTTDWHHLVAVKDGASSREIYVDGVAVGTGGSDSTLANAGGASGIGAQLGASNFFNGSLDEVAVYNYALSSAQILAHYLAGATTDVTVTPTTAALTTTAFAPTVSTPVLCTPTTASLATETFAPTVSTPQTVTPDVAALTLTTFAPTVTGGAGTTVTPDTASLTTATFAPTVTASDHKLVTPDVVALTTTAFAPTVTLTDHQLVTPAAAALTLATFAASVLIPQTVTPSPIALSLSTFAPTVGVDVAGAIIGGSAPPIGMAVHLVPSGRALHEDP
jgi:hypothetical protein